MEDDQTVDHLAKAQHEVKKYAFHWKRAKDKNDLAEVLSNVSSMIYELRTSDLTPKQYYHLYIDVTANLRELNTYFGELNRAGMPMEEIYHRVQETSKVLPRMYMLAVAGAVYIESKEAAARDILRDLVEMAKGVQFPMRALFLRKFIGEQTKGLLPDDNNEYSGAGGTVEDSIDFVLQNFTQMNKLWVRMQFMGSRRRRGRTLTDAQKAERRKRKEKIENQRKDLKILVGINLQIVLQLDGVSVDVYRDQILPNILEQVTNCRDTIAQEYLMDMVIQAAPCEYHLHTLEPYLSTCAELNGKADVSKLLGHFMDTISEYSKTESNAIPAEIEVFKTFDDHVAKVIDSTDMSLDGVLELKHSQLKFALSCAKSRTEKLVYAGHILRFCADLTCKFASGQRLDPDSAESKLVVKLLQASIKALSADVLNPEVAHFGKLLQCLPWIQRKVVAVNLMNALVDEDESVINTPTLVKTLLAYVMPLVKDEDDADGSYYSTMGKQFVQEQLMMAKFVQTIDSVDGDLASLFNMYQMARQQFGRGGINRIKYTLLPLVFAVLKLIDRVDAAGPSCPVKLKKLFKFAHETITALASNHAHVSLRLFLQTALAADRLAGSGRGKDYSAIAYEFIVQSFILYEEMADSKQQRAAINQIIGSLYQCVHFEKEEYENLVTRVTQYAAKLLKKPDQCRMVQLCCQLFWANDEKFKKKYEDTRRVLECLQRCLKIADACMGDHTQLFVEVLNSYLYFFEHGCPTITPKYIAGLIALIKANNANDTDGDAAAHTDTFFVNTLDHIRSLKNDPKLKELLQGIDV